MDRRFCWAFLLTLAAAKEQLEAAEIANRATQGKTLTATFQPGKLGIGADWNRGVVTRVDKGGQGDVEGLQVEDRIQKIDGRTYTEKLIDKRIAGTEPFEMTLFRPPPKDATDEAVATPKAPAPKKIDPDDPPKPDFKYATELNATSFKELVYKVTNGTDSTNPPYYPMVMFHMSWCKHCRHALPEFENAAKMIDEQSHKGNSKVVKPRFFVLECDGPVGNKEVCDMFGHSTYPVIKVFRDGRAVHFNRPRMAQTLAWWAGQVTRPPVIGITTKDDIKMFSDRGQFFALVCDDNNQELLKNWADVAIDNIQELTFAYVKPGSAASKSLLPAPSINAIGEDLEPLPIVGEMTREAMSAWVNFNQFKPVVDLTFYTEGSMRKSGFVVITFLYDATIWTQVKELEKFEAKAKELRKTSKYLFASVDSSSQDNRDFVDYAFPLLMRFGPIPGLSPKLAHTPVIFAFEEKGIYWENPSLQDPDELSMESIEAFLADSWNHQDSSDVPSMAKEKGKMLVRFSTGSAMGMGMAVVAMLLVAACLYGILACTKAVFSSDDDADETKKDK